MLGVRGRRCQPFSPRSPLHGAKKLRHGDRRHGPFAARREDAAVTRRQLELWSERGVGAQPAAVGDSRALAARLRGFRSGERTTELRSVRAADGSVEVELFANEFWTPRQRDANSLHEVSYRACFKPALPRFFIEALTAPGDRVHDPFLGRGTTAIEAALLGRVPSGCDVNPLSAVLCAPRLAPPTLAEIQARLAALDLSPTGPLPEELLVFFHRETLAEIVALRAYLLAREAAGELDGVDRWIRMVTVNRLTGHSTGFLSVYTLPPNQAVSLAAQQKINLKRNQVPPRRDLRAVVGKKSAALLADCDAATRATLARVAPHAQLLCGSSEATPALAADSVDLVVTSPPFLDVVQYRADNWLRCWFCGIDASAVPVAELRNLSAWEALMTRVLGEQRRVLRPGGHVAFEVGEVRGGTIRLEEQVLACATRAGLECCWVLIQDHAFTKTANCWGIDNNRKGTNTHRVVLLRRPLEAPRAASETAPG